MNNSTVAVQTGTFCIDLELLPACLSVVTYCLLQEGTQRLRTCVTGDAGEKLPRDWAEGRQLALLGQRPVLRSVIQRMLQPNPADRPSAAELVQQACIRLFYHFL